MRKGDRPWECSKPHPAAAGTPRRAGRARPPAAGTRTDGSPPTAPPPPRWGSSAQTSKKVRALFMASEAAMTSNSSSSRVSSSITLPLVIRVPSQKPPPFALAAEHEVVLELAEVVLSGEHDPARVQAVEAWLLAVLIGVGVSGRLAAAPGVQLWAYSSAALFGSTY